LSWAKIDDALDENGKIVPISDAAFRAYITSICYSARNESDGFILAKKAKEFAGRPRIIQELTECRKASPNKTPSPLWEPVDGGFLVHDFLEYNPSHAEQEEKRTKDSARKRNGIAEESKRPGPQPDPVPLPDPQLTPQQQLMRVWSNKCGILPSSFMDEFRRYVEKVSFEWFEQAIEITRTEADRPNWKFCRAVLDRALDNNLPPAHKEEKAKTVGPRAKQILERAKSKYELEAAKP
jgi:hypothetical protein